jgi:hypothetical protein
VVNVGSFFRPRQPKVPPVHPKTAVAHPPPIRDNTPKIIDNPLKINTLRKSSSNRLKMPIRNRRVLARHLRFI